MNNLDLYLNAIPSIKEKIESYPLEITEGTHKVIAEYKIHAAKERNRSVNELLASYRSDMESIKTVLQAKAQNLTPTGENPNIVPLTEQVRNLKRILKYDNPYNEVFEKTKLAKICYDLDRVEQNNLTEINQILSYVVEKFRLSGVVLSAQDFDYSIYAREYMTVFFQVSGDANRSEELERTFNSLYWKCPMLLTHLKLSIRSLVKKHNKALSAYCTRHKKELLEQTSTTEETFREAYLQKKSQLTVIKRQDAYTLVESFKNKDENISDYLETNTNRNKKLDSFVVTGSFATLSEPEQEKYFQNMMELNRTLEEWMTIDHFRFILEDVKKRMEDAKNHKNDVKTKEKEIAKLEKNRAKIVKKYDILIDKDFDRFPALAHAVTGAAVARAEYGADEEIANAIRYHTTGRPGMSKLEKILYLADYIEPTRDFKGLEETRELAYRDLDAAVLRATAECLIYNLKKARPIHPVTIEAYNEMAEAAAKSLS